MSLDKYMLYPTQGTEHYPTQNYPHALPESVHPPPHKGSRSSESFTTD